MFRRERERERERGIETKICFLPACSHRNAQVALTQVRGRERAPHLLLSAVVVPRETRQVKDLSALRLAFWFKQIFEVIFAAINFDSFRKKTKNNN